MEPKTTGTWRVEDFNGFDSLKFDEKVPIGDLGEHDCLVKIEAASLNYRDLAIIMGLYPYPPKSGVVPGSDGAGTIISVGKRVTRFKKGDKVCTLFNQGHIYGSVSPQIHQTGLGGAIDGTLRQHGVFDENGLVPMPSSLSFYEASTLSCAAVTAWNALYGLEGRRLKPGDTVLTQGTGGVSIFALQFAIAGGATVIATTSSPEKEKRLKELGADHVINYRTDPEWGSTARNLTRDSEGVDFVVEVGGPKTISQSLDAIKADGIIAVVGFLSGVKGEEEPSYQRVLTSTSVVRGVNVGSRLQFEEMNRAIEGIGLRPIVDKKVFRLEELKEAYQYLWEQRHFGKLVVDCS